MYNLYSDAVVRQTRPTNEGNCKLALNRVGKEGLIVHVGVLYFDGIECMQIEHKSLSICVELSTCM